MLQPSATTTTSFAAQDTAPSRQAPVLNAAEERALIIAYQNTGDQAAAHRLVAAGMPLVYKAARKYRIRNLSVAELIQEGSLGLLYALEKFDTRRTVRFATYAQWWIKAYILKFVRDNHSIVKLGTTQAQRKVYYRLAKTRAQLEQSGTSVTLAVLAQHLGVAEDIVREMANRMKRDDVSLDATPHTYHQTPDGGASPEDRVAHAERLHRFQHHIDAFREQLSDRDRIIFDQRMIADTPQTLSQLSAALNISRERVRQLETRLLKRLRARVVRSTWHDLR